MIALDCEYVSCHVRENGVPANGPKFEMPEAQALEKQMELFRRHVVGPVNEALKKKDKKIGWVVHRGKGSEVESMV